MDGLLSGFEQTPESQTGFLKRIEPYLHINEWLGWIQSSFGYQKIEYHRYDKDLEVLLRILLVQYLFSFSDDAILDKLHNCASLRAFVGVLGNDRHMPAHNDITCFRNLLKKHDLEQKITDDLTDTLIESGLLMKVTTSKKSVKEQSRLTLVIKFLLLVSLLITTILGTVLILNMMIGRHISFSPPKTSVPTIDPAQNTDDALGNSTVVARDQAIVVWLDIDNIIIYEEASVEANVLTVLSGKQEAILLNSANGWCHIQVGDIVGYVKLSVILMPTLNL